MQPIYSQGSDYGSGTGIPGVDERAMRNTFRAIDIDKDGQISGRDLRTFLEGLGEAPSDAEINEMIRMADRGLDGSVHLSEFIELFKPTTQEGHPNEVYEETLKIMSSMRVDARDQTESSEEQLKRFISHLPGSVPGAPFITRAFLKDIISRWKATKGDAVTAKEFFDLVKVRPTDTGERVFNIITNNTGHIDIKSLILTLGVFVAAPCDERIDFACRLMDDTNTGLHTEEQISRILQTNCVGVRTDLKARLQRVMKDSDANSLVSRKQLTVLAKYDAAVLFPATRIEFPSLYRSASSVNLHHIGNITRMHNRKK